MFPIGVCTSDEICMIPRMSMVQCVASSYTTAGGMCGHDDDYVHLIQLSGTKPKLSVEYQISRLDLSTNEWITEGSVWGNSQAHTSHPGHMQLISVHDEPTGNIHPHPLSVQMHVARPHDVSLYKWVEGEMNHVSEDNHRKAFWEYGSSFDFAPRVTSETASVCTLSPGMSSISTSNTDSLVKTPGSDDFEHIIYDHVNRTVSAYYQKSLRLKAAFEMRLPITKTISRSGVLNQGGIICQNIRKENATNENEEILRCNITDVLVYLFHCLHFTFR